MNLIQIHRIEDLAKSLAWMNSELFKEHTYEGD